MGLVMGEMLFPFVRKHRVRYVGRFVVVIWISFSARLSVLVLKFSYIS